MSFDYGAEPVESAGKDFKDPSIGPHSARIRSIIHMGVFEEEFQGKKKAPAPIVSVIFELKDEEDFEDDGETPLEVHKMFSLRKGDKAFLTKFIKAIDPKGEKSGFDDFIGLPCQIDMVQGKEKKAGSGEHYVNFGGVTGMLKKLADITDPLTVEGVGHVSFENLTKEAIMELHPISEVANTLMQGLNYQGSGAQAIIDEIRAENPEFAKRKPKDGEGAAEKPADKPAPKSDLDEEAEF